MEQTAVTQMLVLHQCDKQNTVAEENREHVEILPVQAENRSSVAYCGADQVLCGEQGDDDKERFKAGREALVTFFRVHDADANAQEMPKLKPLHDGRVAEVP